MRSVSDIRQLLNELDRQPATDLEDQDLHFKDWSCRSTAAAVALVVEIAICMANGRGGTVVFGVNDRAVGRRKAIVGVPPDVDVNRHKKAVYDSTPACHPTPIQPAAARFASAGIASHSPARCVGASWWKPVKPIIPRSKFRAIPHRISLRQRWSSFVRLPGRNGPLRNS